MVFKCLTDTIMLDDFKTELKRLGIKRIQKEEKRRQSVALVLDDKEQDEDDEVEFADALNTNPARFFGKKNSSSAAEQPDSPPRRMRHESMEMNGSADHRGEPKQGLGKEGKKIAPLPGLNKFGFQSINPGKRKVKDPYDLEYSDDEDEDEDQSPTQPRSKSPPERQEKSDDGEPGSSSSTEGKNDMEQDFGGIDFQTKPAGL